MSRLIQMICALGDGRLRRVGIAAAGIAVAGALWAPSFAEADYGQMPEHFGASGEAAMLEFATGLAVNSTGAGLPPGEAGSFYVVSRNQRVARFSHGEAGHEPTFQEAWGWEISTNASGGFERCGPAVPAHPHCLPEASKGSGEEVGHFGILNGVAVDQATGNVYVLNTRLEPNRRNHLIEVFSATGVPIGEGFANGAASESELTSESPGSLHEGIENGIAVDEAGVVYVTDHDPTENPGGDARVASFAPCTPNDYEHYCYTGQSHDITTAYSQWFTQLALAGPNRVVAAGKERIREYATTSGGSTAICTAQVVGGGLQSMTANAQTGEVFYFSGKDHKVHRLGACNEATGTFGVAQAGAIPVSPATTRMEAMGIDPSLGWSAQRPPGTLYAVDTSKKNAEHPGPPIGDVFAPAEVLPPVVKTETVANTTASSSVLQAQIDPQGTTTGFRFQYLSEEAYEANEPDERQSLTVSATGGLFGLSFRERSLGGTAKANLTAGSKVAEGLVTATGSASLHAAKGTATLTGGVGKGTVISGSAQATAVSATEGAFAVGQVIVGEGIPSGTTITAVAGTELTLSQAATKSIAATPLRAGTPTLTSVSVSEGTFEVGQTIEGAGIPPGTTITAVAGTELTLSQAVQKPGAAVAITAASKVLTNVVASEGVFEPGAAIAGAGIPAGSTIAEVHPGSLTISNFPTQAGAAVEISSSGPTPLAVGQTIEGPGVPPGTTIASVEAGRLTMSAAAESTGAAVHLRAGLPFDATPVEVQRALEGLSTIGEGNVEVSGGPGDGTGSSPYEVEFTGSLSNQELPALAADGSGLSGGSATAVVSTDHDGGQGFSSGAIEAPVGGGEIPGASVGLATAAVSGLAPDTEYRFRVIATSHCDPEHPETSCEDDGAAAAFRTYPAPGAGLPDGRAYELVSPTEKHGGEVFPAAPGVGSCSSTCKPPGVVGAVFPMQSTSEGDAVSYMGYPFAPNEGAAVYNSYISHRTAGGWMTTTVSPSLLSGTGGEDLVFDRGLAKGLIQQDAPQLAPDAPVGYANLYLQGTAEPEALEPLLTVPPPNRPAGTFRLNYGGHSPDFAAQFFAANDALTGSDAYAPAPADPGPSASDLYEWRGGQLALVNVLPGNASVASGAAFASASPDAHGVSDNGRRVFWHVGSSLYVREDGQITREIKHSGTFLTASPDGLQVLFADGCLYSLQTEACIDLTDGKGGFQGMVGQSDDLARIYFVDTARLPGSGENERGQEAKAGAFNLYLYRAGGGSTYVATLLVTDNGVGVARLADWTSGPEQRTAEASPDGRFLAFGSTARLTGYDNVGPCEQRPINESDQYETVQSPCGEVFLYDSATGRLTCPSCNATGEAPLGNSTLRRIEGTSGKGWISMPRYLTDDGRLFFDSGDRLSPRDTNGTVEDVYEYEPSGIGSCARAQGCVSLISPGSGSVDSNFLAMDEGGSDVFFTTRERLVHKDTDELVDLYDAREGGGFPSESEAPRTECQGEACQPPPSPPASSTPASSTFRGAGNVKNKKATKCPNGRKKNGKCIKKKHKKHSNRHRGGAK